MSLLEITKSLLRAHGIVPKKSLGQNFTVEPQVLQSMIDHASLDPDDTVLDVGAGLGFLTDMLRRACKSVLAIEVDSRLAVVLRERLKEAPNVTIIEGDFLKTSLPTFNKVVSIPPYHVSSRLLLWLFDRMFDCAVLVFQEEFAYRLVAPVRSENYGWLTVLTDRYAEIELLDRVPKQRFYPQPKIGSVIVRVEPKRRIRHALRNEKFFKQLVQSCFAKRNRKVKNAVSRFMRDVLRASEEETVALEALPFRDKRVRELTPEDFEVLADALIG